MSGVNYQVVQVADAASQIPIGFSSGAPSSLGKMTMNYCLNNKCIFIINIFK